MAKAAKKIKTDLALIRQYLERLKLEYESDLENKNRLRLYYEKTNVLPKSEISIDLIAGDTLLIYWHRVVRAEPDNTELFRYLLSANGKYAHGKFGYDEKTGHVSWGLALRLSAESPLPFDVFEHRLGIVTNWIGEIFPTLEKKGGKRIAVGG